MCKLFWLFFSYRVFFSFIEIIVLGLHSIFFSLIFDLFVTWSESNSQNTQSMFREETLLYSVQGARWKISTNRAYLLRFSVHNYTLQLNHHAYLIHMFRLTIAYSLCWASMTCCSPEQSSQSLLHLCGGSLVVFSGHLGKNTPTPFVLLWSWVIWGHQGLCFSCHPLCFSMPKEDVCP